MFKLIVKCRKANVTHMLLPSVFVAVHEEKRKEAAQHKHKEREGLEYNRRAVFENRRESLHIWYSLDETPFNGFFVTFQRMCNFVTQPIFHRSQSRNFLMCI